MFSKKVEEFDELKQLLGTRERDSNTLALRVEELHDF